MALPLAYFLTWSCYGQRLHGDKRGSVDDDHNVRGTPKLPPDPEREAFERDRMKGSSVVLTNTMRQVVDASIVELCARRSWRLIARNARTTHVHVVVNCRGTTSPERAMGQFKAKGTFALRNAGLAAADAHLWGSHGSTRWINHYPGLFGAIAYVSDWQSGPNREMLEGRKRQLREIADGLRSWLRAQGLPDDGRTVVIGEDAVEREYRVVSELGSTSPEQSAGA
jgi:REP element-mobilizing transposase RayT